MCRLKLNIKKFHRFSAAVFLRFVNRELKITLRFRGIPVNRIEAHTPLHDSHEIVTK